MTGLDNDRALEPVSAAALERVLRALRRQREVRKAGSRVPRTRLSGAQRVRVLAKTDRRCHICGGSITGPWQADHVLAYSGGGRHTEDNYLPAHPLCNNYRWDYLAEEFHYILKLGVWARTQIEVGTPLGRSIAHGFVVHELRRRARRHGRARAATSAGP